MHRIVLMLLVLAVTLTGCGSLLSRNQVLSVTPSRWQPRSLHRGFLAPMKTDDIRTSSFCPARTLVETGKVVETGDVLAELDTTDLEKRLRVLDADRRMHEVRLDKAQTMATLPLVWLEQKCQRAQVEVQRRQEELNKALEARDWKKILQTRENNRVFTFEQSLLQQRIQAGKALTAKGFSARLEEWTREKELTLTDLEASFSARLLPWLLETAVEKEVLQARLAGDNASEALQLARLEKHVQTRLLEIDRETAAQDLEEIRVQMNRVRSEIASSVIRAPFQGVCVRMHTFNGTAMEEIKEGDRVFPGIPFLSLLRGGRTGVEFLVSQQDIGLLKEGWRVEFRPDSYPEYILPGAVTECAAMAMESETADPMGERTLRVKAALEKAPASLRYGMTGTVFLMPPGDGVPSLAIPRWQLEPLTVGWRSRQGFVPLPETAQVLGCDAQMVHFAPQESLPVRVPEDSPETLVEKVFKREVSLPGDIRARVRAFVDAGQTARLAWLAEDGKQVKKGEVVARLDVSEVEKNLADLEVQNTTKSEQLRLLREKNLAEARRQEQKRVMARQTLEIARLEHRMLLHRRDEDKIINLRKSQEIVESRLKLLEETIGMEKELVRRGLKSELDARSTQLQALKLRAEKAVNQQSLKWEEDGPTPRQVRLSEFAQRLAEIDVSLADGEIEKNLALARFEEKLLEAELEKITVDLELARGKKSRSEIHAPIDGMVIVPETWRAGQMARVKAGDQVGMIPFMQVADLRSLEIRLEVSEMDVKFLQPGRPVTFTVKAAPGKIFAGAVREVGQIVDSRSRSRPDGVAETLISIGDPQQKEPLLDPAIRPGTTSEVSLELYNVPQAPVFPWGSLIPGPAGATLLEADGASRPVALLLSDGLAGGVASESVSPGFRFRMPGGAR